MLPFIIGTVVGIALVLFGVVIGVGIAAANAGKIASSMLRNATYVRDDGTVARVACPDKDFELVDASMREHGFIRVGDVTLVGGDHSPH